MKKLLLLFTAFIIIVFTNCKWDDSKKPGDCPEKCTTKTESYDIKGDGKVNSVQLNRQYRCNEYVVSFCSQNQALRDSVHDYLLRKGGIKSNTCPCSGAIELWNFPVGPAPDGADATPPPGGQGWEIVKNFIVADIEPADTFSNRTIDSVPDKYPPVTKPLNTVYLAIDDSGVEKDNTRLVPYLFKNPANTLFCNPIIREGLNGMNILNRDGLLTLPTPLNPSDPLDTDGHGTFISGVVAGIVEPKGSNGAPKRFIADNAGINIEQIHAKIFNDRKSGGDLFTALCGIHYSIEKGAKVINLSWAVVTVNAEEAKKVKTVFCSTMERVKKENILLIAAAGNHAMSLDGDAKTWPACFAQAPTSSTEPNYSDYVLSVGSWSVDSTKIAYHSNYGTFVNMYAPGSNIESTGFTDRSTTRVRVRMMIGKGTSYAAPYVSRVSAVLRGLHPGNPIVLPVRKIKNHILFYSESIVEKFRPFPANIKLLDADKIMTNHRVLP